MKYCIVMPSQTEIDDRAYVFPMGIPYVSSSLKHSGRDVTTYNLTYKTGSIEELIGNLVQKNRIDVFMVGGLTADYPMLKRILDAAKAAKPDIILCVGGGIITSAPIPAMEALEVVDYGMIGEGEITVCELAEALEGKRDIHTVNGLVFMEHGSWTLTAPRAEIMDLDSLPYPDYEGFEFGEMLSRKGGSIFDQGLERHGYVSCGRSCPFNCTFCFHPSGSKYRKRSNKSVFAEIDYLIEKYDIRNVFISDELFVAKIEDVREFCTEIVKRKIGFSMYYRIDMVSREILELLRDSGCVQVRFGLESADNRILKSMNKRITVEQIDHALTLCNEVGIKSEGGFIFGDEEETVETYQNTLQWWKDHPQFNIGLNLIQVFPGTALYRNACKRGIIKDEVQFIKNHEYINVTRMTDKEYQNMALEISTLLRPRTDILKDATIQYAGFGMVDCTARCPKCNQLNFWPSREVFRYITEIVCEHCGHKMRVVPVDSMDHHCAEENFQLLKGHKIAIWPVVTATEELRRVVPGVMDDNVYFIDFVQMKQGGNFHGKIVHSPSIIGEEEIDTVFLTIPSHAPVQQLMGELEKYPTVKQVFFAGDLFDPEFPRRLL